MEILGKAEFCREMADAMGATLAEAKGWYDAFVNVFTGALQDGAKIQLVGFVTAEVKERAARTGVNPLTKQKIKIAASKTPAVKFSSSFKKLF